MINNFIEKQRSTADSDLSDPMDTHPGNVRELFAHKTRADPRNDRKNVRKHPAFNDHIDRNTGQMLISIGKKLKRNNRDLIRKP